MVLNAVWSTLPAIASPHNLGVSLAAEQMPETEQKRRSANERRKNDLYLLLHIARMRSKEDSLPRHNCEGNNSIMTVEPHSVVLSAQANSVSPLPFFYSAQDNSVSPLPLFYSAPSPLFSYDQLSREQWRASEAKEQMCARTRDNVKKCACARERENRERRTKRRRRAENRA